MQRGPHEGSRWRLEGGQTSAGSVAGSERPAVHSRVRCIATANSSASSAPSRSMSERFHTCRTAAQRGAHTPEGQPRTAAVQPRGSRDDPMWPRCGRGVGGTVGEALSASRNTSTCCNISAISRPDLGACRSTSTGSCDRSRIGRTYSGSLAASGRGAAPAEGGERGEGGSARRLPARLAAGRSERAEDLVVPRLIKH